MLQKIKNKINIENLPVILFAIIVINLLPLAIPNMFTKQSYAAGTITTIIGFIIEVLLLTYVYWKKIKITDEMKKNIIIVSVITLVLFLVQIINLFLKRMNIQDIANIGCKFLNIILLFIAMFSINVKDEQIHKFMKCIIYLAIIICVYNLIFYAKEIVSLIGIGDTIPNIKIKSFFGNRNQLAFFLYIAIFANIFVLMKDKHIGYKLTLILFMLNLLLSVSRTGILVTMIFLGLYFLTNSKIDKKVKIECIMLALIAGLIMIIVFSHIYPKILEQIYKQFLRTESIHNFSGRTGIWNVGKELLTQNPINALVGVGRFRGIDAIKLSGRTFTQFHNAYLETLVSGGIMELLYIIFIYYTVLKKVLKSNLDKRYKQIYISMFITFYIYMFFESFGRFSMGYVDTLCMIIFISIPILHSNCSKKMIEGMKENDNIKTNI